VEDKLLRYNAQKELHVTYNGKDPMDQIYKEADMFATFCSPTVYEANGDIYLTSDKALADPEKCIYYADFKISEAMRAYIGENHAAHKDLQDFLDTSTIWKEILTNDYSVVEKSEFNFFKLLRKDRDELSFSNALAYFIQKVGLSSFLQDCLQLDAAFLSDSYSLLREKNNIDISFWGARHVVIIENKIDAGITANGNMTIDGQINKAVELYLEKGNEELKHFADPYIGDASQLSKYYLYAVAYLRSKGLDMTEIPHRIRCFLLIPKYAENQFGNEGTSYHSHFRFSQQYEIITYRKILEFFEGHPIDNRYFDDFVSALHPLAKEFNNDIEEEVKYRFFKTIGKV
ncbi:MAG: PD-(D/E)XK nuclease family protein, partial [Clostridia bacterium]|nr:PD-(D/E)XK nuclease family protein [Clostridia bacterium]